MLRESIIGCPNAISYNQWLEDYQNKIFEDPDCFERGPDGEFIYEDHFDSLYSDDEKVIEAPEEEGTSLVANSEECPISNNGQSASVHIEVHAAETEVCFCPICGALGHKPQGCPILLDSNDAWWDGAADEELYSQASSHQQIIGQVMEPQPPVHEPLEPIEEAPLEYSASDKSGVSLEGFIMDKEESLDQNPTSPIDESLTSPYELEMIYIFIIFAVLMRICFTEPEDDQYPGEEEEQEEDLRQGAHYLINPWPHDSVFHASENDVNFVLPSFLHTSSSADSYGGIEFIFEEENNRRALSERQEEDKPTTHLETTPPDDQTVLSLGDPSEDEECQQKEADLYYQVEFEAVEPSADWNGSTFRDNPEELPKLKGTMHGVFRRTKETMHGLKGFPFDTG